ncbi:MAG: DMT family transporter [Chitinophagaceae bacterium]
MIPPGKKKIYIGVILAVVAAIIWSGNFIVARSVSGAVPPISLNFYRWLTASILLFPFVIKGFYKDKQVIYSNWKYLFWVSLTGIALFNTFVYVAGHYTSAINMALIGTTSSPIFATFFAAAFLKEVIRPLRVTGLVICICGIILLLSQGSFERLIAFRFSTGDWWMLLGALFFAIYNTMVKRKPAGLSSLNFLFICFSLGTLILLPFYVWELTNSAPVIWSSSLFGIILYLGLGTSLISYLCWNQSIARLGPSRTALFGNLIPIFSSIEAVLILNERIRLIHVLSGLLVITGLVIANLKKANSA